MYLSKLYDGKLIDNIHGYLFPKSKTVDVKLFIEQHIKELVPANYHKFLTNLTKPKLAKLMVSDKDNKINYFKIPDSKYNKFINIPGRKYLLSGIEHLTLNGPCARYPYRFFILIYIGCLNDNTIWQLTKIFPNVRVLCFEPKLMNIYIEKFENTHWNAYENLDNNISYMSINKNNTTEDDLNIRPVNYFDGEEEISLLNKNTDDIITRKSITDIDPLEVSVFAKHLFESNRRIFIFEEELTIEAMEIIVTMIKNIGTEPQDDVTKLHTSELTLWTNYAPLSKIQECIDVLKPKYVKCIFNVDTKFDMEKFYKPDVYILPWSNRQYPEFAVHISPRVDLIVKVDIKPIIDSIFYYNLIDRVCYHNNPMHDKNIGYDCCGDCALEARILTILKDNYNISNEFFKTMNMQNPSSIFTLICNITGVSTFKVSVHGMLFGHEL